MPGAKRSEAKGPKVMELVPKRLEAKGKETKWPEAKG